MHARRTAALQVIVVVILCTIGLPARADRLFWSRNTGDTIPGLSAHLDSSSTDGSDFVELYQVADRPVGPLDVDPLTGRIYWVESNPVSPTTTVAIVQGFGDTCESLPLAGDSAYIALDAPGGKIYWTEDAFGTGNGQVKRANLDFSSVEVLVAGLNAPFGVGLDTAAGKLYWYDGVDETMMRSNLDGSNVEIQFTIEFLTQFQIDPIEQRIYWHENVAEVFRRADFDGSNIEDLAPQVGAVFAVDVNAGQVYFREGGGFGLPPGELKRADLDGSNEEVLLSGTIAEAGFLVLSPTDQVIPINCGADVPSIGSRGAGVLTLLLILIGTWWLTRWRA